VNFREVNFELRVESPCYVSLRCSISLVDAGHWRRHALEKLKREKVACIQGRF